MTALKVAMIGLGTVGTGVAKILLEQPQRVARRAGRPIELRRVVVRDAKKARGISLPKGAIITDFQSIVSDAEIDVVIELMGGLEPARTRILTLLEAGKNIVTANKALLAQHGDEVFECASRMGKTVAFEAAVAGGIPIISTLSQALTANQIVSIEAILNGTSNFILTEMLRRECSYAEVLAQAQELGFAEADPSMDVDGTDAAQKLLILAQLAFGTRVPLSDFSRHGIDGLELADLQYARELGYTVKLLAVAKLVNGRLEMHVQPTLVRCERPIANVDGAFNMISIEGDMVGKAWLAGQGAGQLPTASAVVADLIDTATGRAALTFPRIDIWRDRPPLPVIPADEISNRYYLRFNVEDRPHVFADVADILGRHQISLASIIQHEAPELEDEGEFAAHPVVPLVVMTHRTSAGKLRAAEAELSRLPSLRPPSIHMLVAD